MLNLILFKEIKNCSLKKLMTEQINISDIIENFVKDLKDRKYIFKC